MCDNNKNKNSILLIKIVYITQNVERISPTYVWDLIGAYEFVHIVSQLEMFLRLVFGHGVRRTVILIGVVNPS